MLLYKSATDEIVEYIYFLSDPKHINTINNAAEITPEIIASCGYYEIQYAEMPSEKYYVSTEVKTIVGSICQVTYSTVAKDINEVKALMLAELSLVFKERQVRPEVVTSLGFSVDGGRTDLENFEIGKEFALPQVRAYDGSFHAVTVDDYDTIIYTIKASGLMEYQNKWTKEAEIEAMTTVAECVLYEATPYIIDGVTYYKNNIKEW